MIEFSDEEVNSIDESIDSVYIEASLSMNNLKDENLFSKSFKMGLSSSVPPNLTHEKVKDYLRLQISNHLRWEYNRALGKNKE